MSKKTSQLSKLAIIGFMMLLVGIIGSFMSLFQALESNFSVWNITTLIVLFVIASIGFAFLTLPILLKEKPKQMHNSFRRYA
jgi:hypothetical protein